MTENRGIAVGYMVAGMVVAILFAWPEGPQASHSFGDTVLNLLLATLVGGCSFAAGTLWEKS